MSTDIRIFGLLFLCWALACLATDMRLEPACSIFEYEEKLLAKIMRLEGRIDEIGDRLTAMEDIGDRLTGIETALEALQREKATKKKECPSNYMYSKRHGLCWRYEKNNKLNWFDAEKICQKEGGHLMMFNSTKTASFIQEYLRAAGLSTQVFIGGNDIEEEGVYMWNNGNPVENIPWHPSSEPTGDRNQNCLVIYESFKFGDYGCYSKREFLCQID